MAKNICIIPARSGSKGVPGKNIKKLGGAPLLWYTIEAAMFAGNAEFEQYAGDPDVPARLDEWFVDFVPVFDKIVVTSDDSEIVDCATEYIERHRYDGSPIPHIIRRDKKLSQDHVQTDEVVLDALRSMEVYDSEFKPDNICLLQPTSPFRNYIHVTESYDYFIRAKANPVKNANCLISGTKVTDNLDGYYWYGNHMLSMMVEPMGHNPTFRMGRQWESPLPNYLYKENGAIYWFDAKQFSLRRFYRMPPFAIYPMDNLSSLDINTMDDWHEAERIVRNWTGVK